MESADCKSYVSFTRIPAFSSIHCGAPPVSDTLVKVDIDVNADGHQSSKTTGKAHAPIGPDPLRQLFARPWNSSCGGPATVSDVEPDRLP
jgi:hypothetical protein